MQHHNPTLSSLSWRTRVRELLSWLLRGRSEQPQFVVWAPMKPIDFEGEDSSLCERDLRHMK